MAVACLSSCEYFAVAFDAAQGFMQHFRTAQYLFLLTLTPINSLTSVALYVASHFIHQAVLSAKRGNTPLQAEKIFSYFT